MNERLINVEIFLWPQPFGLIYIYKFTLHLVCLHNKHETHMRNYEPYLSSEYIF